MRTFTVSILFLVALINGINGHTDEEGRPIREPKIPPIQLNADGSLRRPPHQSNPFFRTKRAISEYSAQICEPRSIVQQDCNTCTCSLDGTALACTRMECVKIPTEYLNPDGSLKLPHQSNPLLRLGRSVFKRSPESEKKQICEPGTTTKVECNTCTCTLDGTALACTRMMCPIIPTEYLNPDGSLKLPHQSNPLLRLRRSYSSVSGEPVNVRRQRQAPSTCVPGTSVPAGDGCNHCFCGPNGRIGGCTLMGCLGIQKLPSH